MAAINSRIHYSKTQVSQVDPPCIPLDFGDKPHSGCFWWGVGEEWRNWCEAESFSLESLAYRYKIDLDESKLLILKTEESLDEFTKRYGTHELHLRNYRINWPQVAKLYAGIEISPYHWSRRYDLLWYYTWDVASGCLWDPSIVRSIKLTQYQRQEEQIT